MHIRSSLFHALVLCTVLSLVVPIAFSHIRIYPNQSTFGAREKYTMRVPKKGSHQQFASRGEFRWTSKFTISSSPGWKIDFKKDEKGKIIGATWIGTIAPYEFVGEFGMLAINPKQVMKCCGTTSITRMVPRRISSPRPMPRCLCCPCRKLSLNPSIRRLLLCPRKSCVCNASRRFSSCPGQSSL